MAEQRQTEDALVAVDVNTDANARVTEEGFLALDINVNANALLTEIVFLGITERASGGIFREMITPLTGHDE